MKIDWHIVGMIAFVKICIFSLLFLSFEFFPFNTVYYFSNFIYPKGEAISLKTAYKTWDAQHFLFLSEKGYHAKNDSNAFPPLYPLAIFLLTTLTKNSFVSGLIISNLCSLVGFYLFYELVSLWFTKKIAYTSLLLLLSFPTSFFFSLIYSESLFFLCLMLFFSFLTKKQIGFAALMALLLPTIRLVGVAIVLPFVSWYVFDMRKLTLFDEVKNIAENMLRKEALLLLSPLLGFGVVLLCMFLFTGNAFAPFDALQQYVSHHSVLSLFNLFSFLGVFFHFPLALHGYTNSIFDRVFFLGFVLLSVLMIRRVSITLLLFSIAFGVLPVLSGSFMSYMRYVAVIFPLYIVLAQLVEEKKYQAFKFPLLFFFILLQTLFVIMHSINYWVA